ncbi:MAG: FAD:protein FMN transferase [Clostridia bacterium]|nr:FAD:protein FMN transferase [Clostridia bacterium]
MKKIGIILSLILISLSTFLFISCADGGSSLDCYYFKTGIHIETHDFNMSDDTQTKLKNLFSSLEKEFDINDSKSTVYAFNNANVGDVFNLSTHGRNVLLSSKNLYSFTDGLFDPSVYPLVELWQFTKNYPVSEFNLPTDTQISTAINNVDFESAVFDQDLKTLTKTKDGVKLDFGGIVKGYAADKAAKILKSAGHESGYISIGGSSLYLLSVESLGIIHPKKATDGISILSVKLNGKKNLSVSTSGDYEKFYERDGKIYSHLINPKTGYTADTNVCSVTVIGADGAFSDAVTTAACLINHLPNDLENSPLQAFLLKILSEYPAASIYAIYDDGENKQVITNQKQGENFTLLDTEYNVVNFN